MRIIGLSLVSGWLLLGAPVAAQAPAWRVSTEPAAGLWFHGMALAGVAGFGTDPLYAPDYRATLATVRRQAGLAATPLEIEPFALGRAFAEDSSLEALHFVPLWFPRSTPLGLLDALTAATTPDAATAEPGREERFGASVVAATVHSPAARRVLAGFAARLRAEWQGGYPGLHRALLPADRGREVAEAWAPLAAQLAPYLKSEHLDGGLVLLSPALGPDGRFFGGRPEDPTDNVLAVRLAPEEPARSAVLRMVRELCYPAVRAALADGPAEPDRVAGEQLSGRVAVRCGHSLLARYAPEAVADYDVLWGTGQSPELPSRVGAALARRIGGR
ncbi:MAG: hypothetical protein SF070_08505 [Gemmatimonadota bacterium]|nr:hypothetical protein [Gemmatimonadota bacterium]